MAQNYNYPAASSGGSGSNASVGTNNAAIPTSATLVAGKSPTSTLVPLNVDADGTLNVSLVDAPSNLSMNLTQVGGAAIALGQAAMTASLPVVIASNQSALTVNLPTGASTSALQTSGNASLTSIDSKTPALGQALAASSVPVVLTAAQLTTLTPLTTITVTQATGTNLHTVVDSSALPTGAATETTLAAMSAKMPATLGQKTMAASLAVTLASDQSALAVSQNSVISTANSTTANLGISGVFTGTSEDVSNYAVIAVNVFADQASASLGLSMQQSSNGTNWDFADTYTIAANTGKLYSVQPGAKFYRLVYTNGATATTNLRIQTIFHYTNIKPSSHSLADTINLQNDAELGISQMRATSGLLSIPLIADSSGNMGSSLAAISGTTVLAGNGVTGAGSQRVTIASDNTAFSVNAIQSGTWTVQPGNTANTTAWLTTQDKAATSAITSVAGSATTVSLLALNTSRKNATFYNDSTAILYLKLGATASTTSYTVQLAAGAYYELPVGRIYTGAIDGIWASATGNVRITELT